MTDSFALFGAAIFDGYNTHDNQALLIESGRVKDIVSSTSLPATTKIVELHGGLLQPGYVDMQVNGGGGTLLNDNPSIDGIRTICQAHQRYGTTALMVTLITDHDDVLDQAIQAAQDAVKQQLPGFLGLHLEGPHLSADKKGAHDASLMRPMSDDDLARLLTASEALPVLMITVAPELVRPEQIRTLSEAGIIVSLGHSNCSYKQAALAIEAGASAITHLYNAMSPLQHRDPGLVGAALHHDETYVSLIADGHHVDSVALSIALKSRGKHPTACLITDAMSTVGTPMKTLTLNGRTIFRDKGVLRLEDGTLVLPMLCICQNNTASKASG